MTELKILRSDGSVSLSVFREASKLEISEPVSSLRNLEEVIGSLPLLETLVFYVTDYGQIDHAKSLDFLREAKRLKGLSLRSTPHLQDCGALIECNSLEWISLSSCVTKKFDFSVLPFLPSLRQLYIEMPDNRIIQKVAAANQLTSLEVRGGFKLKALENLSSLTNLEQLKLWSGSLASSSGLSAFNKLKNLNLGYCKLQDTTDLGSIPGLKKMELLGNKAISDLDFLKEGHLEFLGMYQIPVLKSFKPISRLPMLKEIHSEAKIVDGDLLPLASHPALEKVSLPGRYKAQLKKLTVDSRCVFKVGRETLKLTKNGPLVLETAGEANERLRKKLEAL